MARLQFYPFSWLPGLVGSARTHASAPPPDTTPCLPPLIVASHWHLHTHALTPSKQSLNTLVYTCLGDSKPWF